VLAKRSDGYVRLAFLGNDNFGIVSSRICIGESENTDARACVDRDLRRYYVVQFSVTDPGFLFQPIRYHRIFQLADIRLAS
jgi:hypothetical protein